MKSLPATFMRFVKKQSSECWLWTGSQNGRTDQPSGRYGWYKGEYAHRIAFRLSRGREAQPFCLHHCDVRLCVRPSHLWEGTQKDNIQDALQKRRMAIGRRNGMHTHLEARRYGHLNGAWIHHHKFQGERNAAAKLTRRKVERIRTLYRRGWSYQKLSNRYGVTSTMIGYIVRRKAWINQRVGGHKRG